MEVSHRKLSILIIQGGAKCKVSRIISVCPVKGDIDFLNLVAKKADIDIDIDS